MPAPTPIREIRMPTSISYGAVGGPVWNTQVVASPAGKEVRISLLDEALVEWSVQLQTWDEERIRSLINFFNVCEGKAFGFRFKDWSDYYAGMTLVAGVGLGYTVPHAFATGNGSATVYQLKKRYTVGGHTKERKITRPIRNYTGDVHNAGSGSSTVRIYVAGVLLTEGSDYTLDYTTGKVTFASAPANGAAIAWCGQFDVPARFDTDKMQLSMEGLTLGRWASIPIVGLRE
jgi:uncharacterized protein (TIGR02217 family)